jgi:hypothetical protein
MQEIFSSVNIKIIDIGFEVYIYIYIFSLELRKLDRNDSGLHFTQE